MVESGDLFQSLNSNGKNLQVNTQIVTLEDNLSHPYFSMISLSKNNSYPIGSAVLETPRVPQISKYWIKYKGAVVISFSMEELNQTNTNTSEFLQSHQIKQYNSKKNKEKDKEKKFKPKQRIKNEQYNYSFVGKVGKFKEKGNKIIIHFEDIGWKFLQKVPKEFRDTYISNQPLDQAFQAMCEFLGVEFAYSIEDLHEYSFGADGYSVQKDGQVIEDVETILSEWNTKTEEEEQEDKDKNDELSDPKYENKNLIELDKKNENNEKYIKKNNNDNKINDSASDTQEIVDKYQADFDQKILDLFIGNSYYESDVTSNVMNYDQISVTPTATADTSGTMSTTTNSNNNNKNNQTDGETFGQNLLAQAKGNAALTGIKFKNKKPSLF